MCTHCGSLRSAAFGATPGVDVFAMMQAADPRARWLAAVVLGGQGHYAAAATVLCAMLAHERPLWASLAASTLASHRRQLGAHAEARRLDAAALRSLARPSPARPVRAGADDPDGVDDAGARTDALTGLAADALGTGELSAAHRLLAAAERSVGRPAERSTGDAWRPAVRLAWVRAELALATGEPHAAAASASRAVRLADDAGAVRHAAKSRLVLAAALHSAGELARADELLHELAATTAKHRLVPLRWPTELLLTELLRADNGDPGHLERHRAAASTALRFVLRRADVSLRTAAESSRWVPSEVLKTADSAERSSAGEILSEICTRLCQGSTPRDR